MKIAKDRICNRIFLMVESSEKVVLDSDESIVIVENSNSAQICSGKDMFTEKIEHINYNGVIGKVSWSWTDDEGSSSSPR